MAVIVLIEDDPQIRAAMARALEGIGHVAMLEAPEPTARAVLGMLETLPAG